MSLLHLVRSDCPLPAGTHVVAYCRDSGGEDQERSVVQQIQVVREYCQHHKLVLEEIYTDEAKKGSSAEKRVELSRMMSALTRHHDRILNPDKRQAKAEREPFGVIVWKSNRLGRDQVHMQYINLDLRMRGIKVISLVPSLETGNPMVDAMAEMFQQFQDQQLLQEISDNSKRGLADLVTLRDTSPEFRQHNPDWPTNDGRYLGIVPGPLARGFKPEIITIGTQSRKGKTRGGELRRVQRMVPDPDTWDRCKLAWKMRHEGAPIKQIMQATNLYSSAGTYETFFNNRIYTGTLVYGDMVLENFVPALIPQEWYDAEQERRAERRKKHEARAADPGYEPRRVASRHLLSGLVYCGHVHDEEHPMNAQSVPASGRRGRWDFYMCTKRKNSRKAQCNAPRISAKALEQSVIDIVMREVITIENLRPLAQHISDGLHERNRFIQVQLQTAHAAIEKVQQGIQQLLDVIENGNQSPHITKRLHEREEEERKLLIEIAQLETLMTEQPQQVAESDIIQWIEAVHRGLKSGNVQLARRTLKQFIARVVVKEKHAKVYYTFPFEPKTRLRTVTPTGLEPVYPP